MQRSAPIDRDRMEKLLKRLTEAALKAYDEGHVNVEYRSEQSMVDATAPGDVFRTLAPGPSQRFTLTLRNPKENREEEW